MQEMLLTLTEKTEKFLEKDLLLRQLTLLALYLGYFTEESVVPQKILACIASNCCFRIATQKHVVKIDCESIVSNETANATTVLHYATVLKRKSEKLSRKKLL